MHKYEWIDRCGELWYNENVKSNKSNSKPREHKTELTIAPTDEIKAEVLTESVKVTVADAPVETVKVRFGGDAFDLLKSKRQL